MRLNLVDYRGSLWVRNSFQSGFAERTVKGKDADPALDSMEDKPMKVHKEERRLEGEAKVQN